MNPMESTPQWLTEKELADLLKVSQRHLINLRKAGLPHLRLGTVVRYDGAEVMAYLRDQRRLASRSQNLGEKGGSQP
jgi:excisionase family DNA binding protein